MIIFTEHLLYIAALFFFFAFIAARRVKIFLGVPLRRFTDCIYVEEFTALEWSSNPSRSLTPPPATSARAYRRTWARLLLLLALVLGSFLRFLSMTWLRRRPSKTNRDGFWLGGDTVHALYFEINSTAEGI